MKSRGTPPGMSVHIDSLGKTRKDAHWDPGHYVGPALPLPTDEYPSVEEWDKAVDAIKSIPMLSDDAAIIQYIKERAK